MIKYSLYILEHPQKKSYLILNATKANSGFRTVILVS